MKIIYFVINQYMKYKNPDLMVLLSTRFLLAGITLLGSGVIWAILIEVPAFSIPVELTATPPVANYLGALLLLVSVGLALFRLVQLSNKITGLLLFHKGMEGMEVTDAKSALPKSYSKGKLEVIHILESNQLEQGKVYRPESAIEAIKGISRDIESRLGDQGFSGVKLAYAGLAPIPLLVAAGYMVSSRQKCLVMDCNRGVGWHCLDAPDDGEKIQIIEPENPIDKDIALVMPFSVMIGKEQIPNAYKNAAYSICLENNARVDSMPSEEKQIRIVNELYSFIANLKGSHSDINNIHIFMASQASFAFRFGTVLTASVFPAVTVYQYDPSAQSYAWGVRIANGEGLSIV